MRTLSFCTLVVLPLVLGLLGCSWNVRFKTIDAETNLPIKDVKVSWFRTHRVFMRYVEDLLRQTNTPSTGAVTFDVHRSPEGGGVVFEHPSYRSARANVDGLSGTRARIEVRSPANVSSAPDQPPLTTEPLPQPPGTTWIFTNDELVIVRMYRKEQ